MLFIADIRSLAVKQSRTVAILQDLAGPKVRTGSMAEKSGELVAGQAFTLTSRDVPGDSTEVSVTYKHLPRDVRARDSVLLNDEAIELLVEKVQGGGIRCCVIAGGTFWWGPLSKGDTSTSKGDVARARLLRLGVMRSGASAVLCRPVVLGRAQMERPVGLTRCYDYESPECAEWCRPPAMRSVPQQTPVPRPYHEEMSHHDTPMIRSLGMAARRRCDGS